MTMRILLVFIDGLGIGKYDPVSNPCTHPELKIFNSFSDKARTNGLPLGGLMKPIDASLGLPGIPQSATGQATLLTGVNAVKLLGRHLSGFPNQALRELLEKESLLTKFTQRGKSATFINAYRPIFFEIGPEALIRFLSVTSIANWKAGLKFHDLRDLKNKKALYHDFTNEELILKGYDVPPLTPEKAGMILSNASKKYDFCLYEYFKTDRVAHTQDMKTASQLLLQLEIFIETIVRQMNVLTDLLIVTSDHGNIEDLSVKTHTTNPIPLIAWGKKSTDLLEQTVSLENVAGVLLNFIS